MGFSNLLRNSRFLYALLVAILLCAIVLVFSIFRPGGDAVFKVFTSLASPVAGLAASFLFFHARANVKDPKFQLLWLSMGLGFGMWGLGDVIWGAYDLVFGGLPNVSIADPLYIVGYIPLYIALVIRLKTIQVSPSTVQKWIISIIGVVWTVFAVQMAIRPILADFGSESVFKSLVYLTYPVGDLGLVILSSIILFMLRSGRYTLSWRLIFAGMFVMAFSDILYNYADWNELYYPDGRVTLVTNLADTSYILAYILAGFGAYVYSILWKIKELPDMRISMLPTTYFHAFVGTDRENQVISTSENFFWLMNAKNDSLFYRLPLGETCGIDPKTVQRITGKIIEKSTIYQEEVPIITMDKKPRTVFLSGLATYNMENEFTGMNLVLRADLKTPAELQMPRSRDLQAITRHVLAAASARMKEEDQALRTFFLENIRLLFSVLYQFGGEQHDNDIIAELNQSLQQKSLKAAFNDQVIEISEDYEGEELSCILSDLLQNAHHLVSKIVGEQVVQEKMDEFEQEISQSLPSCLDRNRLRMHAAQSG